MFGPHFRSFIVPAGQFLRNECIGLLRSNTDVLVERCDRALGVALPKGSVAEHVLRSAVVRVELEDFAVTLRNHAFVIRELAVDELGDEFDVAEAELGLGRSQGDFQRVIVVAELARQFRRVAEYLTGEDPCA